MAYTLTNPPSEKCDLTPKNRVWGFFENSNRTRPANRRKPQQPRRKNRPCSYKTASGIPYWPSRDPIEEMGGLNLYGFVDNQGVNLIDISGLIPSYNGYGTVNNNHGNNNNQGSGNRGSMPAITLDITVGYSAQLCAPIGGAFGIQIAGDVSISAGTCFKDGSNVNYRTISATFGISAYVGICTPAHAPSGAVSLGFSCDCPAEDSGSWSGSINVSGNASIATYGCSWNPSSGWSCKAGTDFSRATSAMVTIGGSITYSQTYIY